MLLFGVSVIASLYHCIMYGDKLLWNLVDTILCQLVQEAREQVVV